MGAQPRSLEDAVALTLALPARLTFVLIFLIFQTYSLMLQVYKVSQEEIPEQLTPLQGWFLKWFFLGFLKRDKRRPSFRPQNAAASPASQPTGANPSTQPDSNGSTTQTATPEPRNPGPLNGSSDPHHPPLNGNLNVNNTTKPPEPPTETPPPSDRGPSWTSLWVQGNTIAIFLLGIAFSIPIFNKLQIAQEGLNTANCIAPIDGDIAGDGVRAALWVQQGILWLSVLTGAFLKASQPRPTAVKELAAGLVVTHLSLAIAVLVQIGQGTLTPLDAGIVVMILDAQNAALAVAFSSRETLAARWEVVSISAAQVFGLVVIGVVLARFEEGGFVTDGCECFSFFWWAWQSTCGVTDGRRGVSAAERAVLWAYYAFRWLNSAQNWHFGVRYMWIFNIMEQDKELWDGVGRTEEGGDGTPGVPPTAGFGFLQNLVFGLVSSVAAELTITGYTSGDEPKPFTVGQITAMVIAVTTTLRATWLFIRRFDLLPMIEGKLWSDQTVETEGLDVSEAGNRDGAAEPPSMDVGRGSGSGDDAEKGASSQVDGVPVDAIRPQA